MSDYAPPRLSALQMDVMRVLWAHGPATASEVRDALADTRDLAPTTVSTLLTRLASRGVAEADAARPKRFRALVTEADVRRSMVSDLVSVLFRGRPAELAAHLVRVEDVDPAELARLRALLDDDATDGAADGDA